MLNRRMFLISLTAAIPLAAGSPFAFGKHWDDDDGPGKSHGHGHGHGRGHVHHYFQERDYPLIERYYRGPRDLPPGLRKKYERTGTLPPGWAKRFEPFPPALMERLPPPPPNCEMGYFGGRAVVVNRTTRVILDSIDIAAALSGR